MIKVYYSFDLFDESKGVLHVELPLAETMRAEIPTDLIQAKDHLRVFIQANMLDLANSMINQRKQNFLHSEVLPREHQLMAFNKLPYLLLHIGKRKDLAEFCRQFSQEIIPYLQHLCPGVSSRFYEGYKSRLEKLEKLCDQLIQDPTILKLENQEKPVKIC